MDRTLIDLYNEFIEMRASQVGAEISQETHHHDKVKQNTLIKFLITTNQVNIKITQVDIRFIRKYAAFIRTQLKYSNDYSVKFIQAVGRVLNLGIELDLIIKNPCDLFSYKYDRLMKHNYLDFEELRKLEALKVKDVSVNRSKDIFIFCCYTGLSYSDLSNFNYKEHVFIKNNMEWINIKRKKTDAETLLPLLPKAKEILIKYKNKLPIVNSALFNKNIKFLIRRIQIGKTDITSHSARKTFGMVLHNHYGVPIDSVSKMLGHKNIRTTQQWYVKTDTGKIFIDMVPVINKMAEKTKFSII